MRRYQHYSFDLWMTLIRSNPAFKEARTAYFHKRYNNSGKSAEQVRQIFRQIDISCNSINERTGKNIEAEEMYLMAIAAMHDYDTKEICETDVIELYSDVERLLFENMPLVYSDEVVPVLESLKKAGATISLLSNTAFIKGRTLRKVLEALRLDVYFDFQLYSDELGLSKPNPEIFKHMLLLINNLYEKKHITTDAVIHVGDNKQADIEGAALVGIDGLWVHAGPFTLSRLITK
jgi:putative hydrolase of the HAD superfamily